MFRVIYNISIIKPASLAIEDILMLDDAFLKSMYIFFKFNPFW